MAVALVGIGGQRLQQGGQRGVEKRGEREDEAGRAPVEGDRGVFGGRAELREVSVGEGRTERLR